MRGHECSAIELVSLELPTDVAWDLPPPLDETTLERREVAALMAVPSRA